MCWASVTVTVAIAPTVSKPMLGYILLICAAPLRDFALQSDSMSCTTHGFHCLVVLSLGWQVYCRWHSGSCAIPLCSNKVGCILAGSIYISMWLRKKCTWKDTLVFMMAIHHFSDTCVQLHSLRTYISQSICKLNRRASLFQFLLQSILFEKRASKITRTPRLGSAP